MQPLKKLAVLVLAAAGSACGGGDSAAETTIAVYKQLGSLQCTGGGASLASLERQLAEAGIRVAAATCGLDGNAYAAVCGGPDGRIGIFDVEAQQAPLASPLGFAPLSGLPAAVRGACG